MALRKVAHRGVGFHVKGVVDDTLQHRFERGHVATVSEFTLGVDMAGTLYSRAVDVRERKWKQESETSAMKDAALDEAESQYLPKKRPEFAFTTGVDQRNI